MAQLDMNQLKGQDQVQDGQNPVQSPEQGNEQIEQSANDGQANTPAQSAELISNTSKDGEDNNKIDESQEQTQQNKGVALIQYVSGGVWKDAKNELWADKNQTENILSERKYSIDEYENREDLKFMVGYGAMKVTFV